MKEKKKKHGKLNRKTIVGAGFSEVSPGVWRKGDSHSQSSPRKSHATRVERDPKARAKRPTRIKEKGERENKDGVQYQVFVISYRARPLDGSNCCAKYIEDTFTEKGLIPDDNIFHCPRPPIIKQIIGIPKPEQRTEVFLFRLNETWSEERTKEEVDRELNNFV